VMAIFGEPLKFEKKSSQLFRYASAPEILAPRYDVKNDKTFVRYIVVHHCVDVPGVKSYCKSVLKRTDRSFTIG
jgi:hypothetical protein